LVQYPFSFGSSGVDGDGQGEFRRLPTGRDPKAELRAIEGRSVILDKRVIGEYIE
jgi:hypothetical protein